jgi:hypothetical protein
MELERSLPCSQEPTTCSYPEPDQSSPPPPLSCFFKTYLNIALTSTSAYSNLFFFHLVSQPISRFQYRVEVHVSRLQGVGVIISLDFVTTIMRVG